MVESGQPAASYVTSPSGDKARVGMWLTPLIGHGVMGKETGREQPVPRLGEHAGLGRIRAKKVACGS